MKSTQQRTGDRTSAEVHVDRSIFIQIMDLLVSLFVYLLSLYDIKITAGEKKRKDRTRFM